MRRTRLPNHFGSIRYLGEGRRNAYAVHVPHTPGATAKNGAGELEGAMVYKKNGPGRRKAICYTASWEEGYQVLVLFHAGAITADESADQIHEKIRNINGKKSSPDDDPRNKMIQYAKKMLRDLSLIREETIAENAAEKKHTFRQVYNSFIEHRFGPNASKKRRKETKNGYESVWLKLEPFYNMTLDEVSVDALEARVNLVAGWGYSKTTVSRLVTLIHQLYRYAFDRGYCTSRHGLGVEMPTAKEEHHQDFTDEELKKLWEVYGASGDSDVRRVVRMILIMCYSGFRIKEYETLEFIDGDVPYFRGGLKTAAGRNRVVPVHSKILPLVRAGIMEGRGTFLNGKKNGQFRRDMKRVLVQIGVDDEGGCHRKCYGEAAALEARGGSAADAAENAGTGTTERRYHTPHSTRHTFSRLCESYEVREADRKRLLGHSLKGDVTNDVYGHRSVEELSREVEKTQMSTWDGSR